MDYEKGRRWIRGCHPELGVLVHGWTGWETVQDFDRIRPMHTFWVSPPENDLQQHDTTAQILEQNNPISLCSNSCEPTGHCL